MVLAATTGMRQGEALGLTVASIDFLGRRVSVDRQLVTVANRVELGPPKTASSCGVIPLPTLALDALAAHLAKYPSTGTMGLIFTGPDGEPIRRSQFNHAWRRAVASVGLPSTTTFHVLRHSYGSLLIASGESVVTVQHRLGHSSAAETLSVYAHLLDNAEEASRKLLEGTFSAAPWPQDGPEELGGPEVAGRGPAS